MNSFSQNTIENQFKNGKKDGYSRTIKKFNHGYLHQKYGL